MDCNDAIMSRRPLEERQRILKDSTVGAFAVVTVVFALGMVCGDVFCDLQNRLCGSASDSCCQQGGQRRCGAFVQTYRS